METRERIEQVRECAEHYWQIRDAGRMDEARTMAHNELLDALEMCHIPYMDREDAARIGRVLLENKWILDLLEGHAA